jgi:hypothetical protein
MRRRRSHAGWQTFRMFLEVDCRPRFSASVRRPSISCTPLRLETEMLMRGMMFEVIDWSEDQATLPFEQ